MSDIVERLNALDNASNADHWLAHEAAEEIIKLRADKAAWQGVQQGTATVVKKLEVENEKLRAALKDCADDLEAEINTRYGNVHPALQRRYDRDMASVRAAAAALKDTWDEA